MEPLTALRIPSELSRQQPKAARRNSTRLSKKSSTAMCGFILERIQVSAFEEAFAKYLRSPAQRRLFGLANGRALSRLEGARHRPGDEVITSGYTFMATVGAISSELAPRRSSSISSRNLHDGSGIDRGRHHGVTRAIITKNLYGQAAGYGSRSCRWRSFRKTDVKKTVRRLMARR